MSSDPRDLEGYSRDYRQLPFEPTQAAFRRRLLLAQIARLKPAEVLEVGCGEHPLFTDLPHTRITVVEAAPAFAEAAARRAANRPDVTVLAGRLEDVAERLRPHAMVVVGCLLHEVADPQALLTAVRQVCQPGGWLHVSVPNAKSLHRLLALSMGLIDRVDSLSETQRLMQQRATYDMPALVAELAGSGFEVVDRGSLFVKPFSHAQMQALVDQGFMTTAMLEGLDRLVEHLPLLGSELWCNAVRIDV